VVEKGKLPPKYTFLTLTHEKKTPEQRRWKWVKYEYLPDEMKPYIRPPSKKDSKKETGKAKPKVVRGEGEEQVEQAVELVDDKDLDFTKMENVYNIINKYRQQQISRRSLSPAQQMEVLTIIEKAQSEKPLIKIEVLMLQISALFSSAKLSGGDYFEREMWLETNRILGSLVDLLSVQDKETRQPET